MRHEQISTGARANGRQSVRTTDVTDYNILDAFLTVPRELFVPSKKRALAYSDAEIRINENRILTQPSPLAKLLQLADISSSDLVLIIASNSGYSAALASRLANTVVAVENDDKLTQQAETVISDLGYDNVCNDFGKFEGRRTNTRAL